jgi:hypothetical protein
MTYYPSFSIAIEKTKQTIKENSVLVENQSWQSIPADVSMHTHEVLNHSLTVPVASSLETLRSEIKPNLPWADDHFGERVCGMPINPGLEWANWPFSKSADKFRQSSKFNHNYMERYWPRRAGHDDPTETAAQYVDVGDRRPDNTGLYHRLGDLTDVVSHLVHDPNSRQAYIPIFFPEDTGVHHGGRVPCTLGYHVIHRRGYLHIVYYLRSCDFVRHFRDDIYLTVRLQLWLLEQLRLKDPSWNKVQPGFFTMHIVSLHIFRNDWIPLFGTPYSGRGA